MVGPLARADRYEPEGVAGPVRGQRPGRGRVDSAAGCGRAAASRRATASGRYDGLPARHRDRPGGTLVRGEASRGTGCGNARAVHHRGARRGAEAAHHRAPRGVQLATTSVASSPSCSATTGQVGAVLAAVHHRDVEAPRRADRRAGSASRRRGPHQAAHERVVIGERGSRTRRAPRRRWAIDAADGPSAGVLEPRRPGRARPARPLAVDRAAGDADRGVPQSLMSSAGASLARHARRRTCASSTSASGAISHARREQFLAHAAGERDGAGGVAVQQDGVARDRDVGRPPTRADHALGHQPDRPLGDLSRVVDDRAGLAPRHQRAVVAVGPVGDPDDADPQAARAGGVGEFAVLRQHDQDRSREATASATAAA